MIKQMFLILLLSMTILADTKIMKAGWNLTTLPSSSLEEMPYSSVVWNYDTVNKTWKAFSKMSAYTLSKNGIDLLKNTTTAKAYWVYAYDDFVISFNDTSIENFEYSTLDFGWNMLGTYTGINDLSTITKDSKIAWMYENDIWSVKFFDDTIVYSTNYNQFTSIPAKAGFWLFNDRDKFNKTKKLNFQDIDTKYLSLIIGKDLNQNTILSRTLHQVETNSDTENKVSTVSQKLFSELKLAIENSINKSSSSSIVSPRHLAKITHNGGNSYSSYEITNGSIEGTLTTNVVMDIGTGVLTGTMVYNNYKDIEYTNCISNEIDSYHGTWNVTATINTTTLDIETMSMTSNANFLMDDMTINDGFTISAVYDNQSSYEDDMTMTISAEFSYNNLSYGFQNYKIRDYVYNGYVWSYPIDGKIYIFDAQINGYFSVDTNYNHSATPTQEDFCGLYTYQGTEKYIGDNSTLIYTTPATNEYKIELDYDNNGVFEIILTGTLND